MSKKTAVMLSLLVFTLVLATITIVSASDPGTVAVWHFDEGTGKVAYDSSGYDNYGTLSGGRFGGALLFDGVDDFVHVPDSSSLDLSSAITIEAWVYINEYPSIGDGSTLSKRWAYYLTIKSDGKVGAYTYGTTPQEWFLSDSSVPLKQWTHIAFTFDGSNIKIYINGVEDKSAARSGSITTTNEWVALGRVGTSGGVEPDRAFNGMIDEIKISDVAKTGFSLGTPPDTTDAVALWHFDEGTGQIATDSAGSNDGQLGSTAGTDVNDPVWITPGPTWVPGVSGTALCFDGTDDVVYIANEPNFDFDYDDPFSIEVWIKTDSDNVMNIISKYDNEAPNRGFQLIKHGSSFGNKLFFFLTNTYAYPGGNQIRCSGSTDVADGFWHHVVVTYDGSGSLSGLQIYLDGVPETLASSADTVTSSTLNDLPLQISGREGTNYVFDGCIDEVRIWDTVLSPETAKAHANGLVGEWDFNEGSGTTVYDSSGFENHGTIFAATWDTGRHGSAINFDGSYDYIELPSSNSLQLSSQGTIEFWFKPGTNFDGHDSFIIKGAAGGSGGSADLEYGVNRHSSDGSIKGWISDHTGFDMIFTTTQTWNTDAWYHISFTWDGSELNIYVNGQQDATPVTQTRDAFVSTDDITMGRIRAHWYDGLLDEVRIWSQALVPVTFTETGLEECAIGTVVTVDDPIYLEYADLPYVMMVPIGAEVFYDYTDEILCDGNTEKKFVLLDSGDDTDTLTIAGPTTVTGVYKTQYYLTVNNGGHGTAGGEGWYDAGTYAQATITPHTVAGSAGIQYVFTGWTGDASGSGSPSENILMDGPKTATATWITQYWFDVFGAPGGAVGGSFDITYTVDGVTYTDESHTTDWASWVDAGSSVSISNPETPIVDGSTQYVFNSYSESFPYTVNAPGHVTLNYDTQYYLTVTTVPGSLSPSPTGEGWYDEGTDVELTAPLVSGHTFLYWEIDSVKQSDGEETVSVTMDAAHTADAHYFEWVRVSGTKYEDVDGEEANLARLENWPIYLEFCDDFEADTVGGPATNWSPENGVWTVVDDGDSNAYQQSQMLSGRVSYSTIPGYDFTDGIFEVKVKGSTSGQHIIWRSQGGVSSDYYFFGWHFGNNNIRWGKFESDSATIIDSVTNYLLPNVYYTLKVVAEGNNFDMYIDNVLIFSVTDSTFSSGSVGFHCADVTYYDDVCIYQQTYTDSNGDFSFTVKDPGVYYLKEELPAGWTQTSPNMIVGDESIDMIADGYMITITEEDGGITISENDFWNFEWMTVTARKVTSEGSPVLDWEISVDGQTDVTGADGFVSFTLTQPGPYTISEETRADWTALGPTSYTFTAESGVDTESFIFENFEWVTVSGYKYEYNSPFCDDFESYTLGTDASTTWNVMGGTWSIIDDSGNKVYRGTRTEPNPYDAIAISNLNFDTKDMSIEVDFKELGGNNWKNGFIVFDYNGPNDYKFAGLAVGAKEYRIQHYEGGPSAIRDMTLADSSISPNVWYPMKVVIEDNTVSLYIDGNKKIEYTYPSVGNGKIGLLSWSADAIFDNFCATPTLIPLDGWVIELYKDAVKVGEATTGSGVPGYYEFTVTDPGNYMVKEVLKPDWTKIYPTSEGHSFTATSGEDVSELDFWNFEWMTVTGYKFFDGDGGGTNDNEPGLEYWVIDLYKDGSSYGTDTTDNNGYYEILIMDPGIYTVTENLLADWWMRTNDDHTFTVVSGEGITYDFGNWLGPSEITTSGLCWFDLDEDTDEREFKLIFTPDVNDDPLAYKLSASNPGQFYYNAFYTGTLETGETLTLEWPYPFETQGANPVHIYSSIKNTMTGCIMVDEESDITEQFAVTIDENGVTIEGDYVGFLYINVHLDYGLKGTGDYDLMAESVDGPFHAVNSETIKDGTNYDFRFTDDEGNEDTQSIYNINIFKKIRGFIGMVVDSAGTGLFEHIVRITGPDDVVLGVVETDIDGFYGLVFKHTGKKAQYTIELITTTPVEPNPATAMLKANGYAYIEFTVP